MKLTLSMIVLSTLVCNACAFLPGNSNVPTIASLGKDPLELDDIPVAANEAQAISAYRQFLNTKDQSDARPQAMRRLADLNLEAEELPHEAQDTTGVTPLYIERAGDSIQLYQAVLARYPARTGNDSVLYQLARAYERNGQAQQSLDTLARLNQQYPESRHVQETRFRRGEILFVQKNYRAAEQAYQAIVSAGNNTPFYQQALYKLGWCLFKQSLFTESLDAFIALLDIKLPGNIQGDDRLAALGRADRELVDDTLRVISLGFSYENGADTVSRYFLHSGSRPYEDVIYERLGLLYLQKERYTDAAQTFQAFVNQNTHHQRSPAFQMRVIETYQQGRFPSLVLAAKRTFVDQYQLQSEYWQHYPPADNQQVLDYLKLTMTDLSRHYHALAQKRHKPEDYQQAAHWYRSYLDSFSDDAAAPKMNFLLAELLYESGNYPQATHEYVQTAYAYGSHKQAADAGYAAVLAYTRQEQTLGATDKQAWRHASIENALRFATTFPEHPQSIAVLTRTSENLLAAGELERASQVAESVIGNSRASMNQQQVVWTVFAHARFDLQDYLQAEAAYQQVLSGMSQADISKSPFYEKLAAAIYKQGEAEQIAGNTAVSVEHFLRVRDITPAAGIVATAEYDAAAGLMSLQQWTQAAIVMDRFRHAWPKDQRQTEITRRLATAYLAGGQLLQAADEFRRIGHEHTDPVLRREALWQSAELYATAQRPQLSIDQYKSIIKKFPQPIVNSIEARHRIAEHYRLENNIEEHHRWLANIIKADKEAGKQRSDRTRFLAATARLVLADTIYETYRAVRLDLPLKKNLATKKRLMQRALTLYEAAADYQVAEVTTAATFRTAEIYTRLSEALLDSQRPENLAGETLEQYNILLEEQAYPFEEQAISLHETNVKRIESGLYDAWIARSQQQLAQLVPARYAKLERSAAYVTAMH